MKYLKENPSDCCRILLSNISLDFF